MKIKEKVTKQNVYICDHCGKESNFESDAKVCEKRCKCKHGNVYYELEMADIHGTYEGVIKECKDCGKTVETVDFRQIDDKQNVIKQIFDICKEAGL